MSHKEASNCKVYLEGVDSAELDNGWSTILVVGVDEMMPLIASCKSGHEKDADFLDQVSKLSTIPGTFVEVG